MRFTMLKIFGENISIQCRHVLDIFFYYYFFINNSNTLYVLRKKSFIPYFAVLQNGVGVFAFLICLISFPFRSS